MDGTLAAMRAAVEALDRDGVADAIQAIGFECTDCGACCRSDDGAHVATVFPDEARRLADAGDDAWRDVVDPMPFGLDADGAGTTLEWSLASTPCGDCRFLAMDGARSRCTRYAARPSICRSYPFTLAQSPEGAPQGEAVDRRGPVVAHACEGLGRDIERDDALALADELLTRAERSIDEALAVRDQLARGDPPVAETVVVDSEGYKHPDGTSLERTGPQR